MPFKDLDYADLSESDIDELVSDGDGDDTKLNVAGDSNRLLRGSLQRPRHSTLNSKQLHGELDFWGVSPIRRRIS